MSVAVMSDSEWVGLTRALERPEWLEDPRFRTPALRDENIDDRLSLTQEALRTRTTAAWMERLEAEGVPCAPVLTRNALVAHPQVAAAGTLVEVDHPIAGSDCARRGRRRVSRPRPARSAAARQRSASTPRSCWARPGSPPPTSLALQDAGVVA